MASNDDDIRSISTSPFLSPVGEEEEPSDWDEEGDEAGEQAQDSSESGEEKHARKRRKISASYTLDDTYQHIKEQPPLANCSDDTNPIVMPDVARRLIEKLRSLTKNPSVDFPDTDLCILGSILFVDIFGKIGQANYIRLVQEYNQKRNGNVRATWEKAKIHDKLTAFG